MVFKSFYGNNIKLKYKLIVAKLCRFLFHIAKSLIFSVLHYNPINTETFMI